MSRSTIPTLAAALALAGCGVRAYKPPAPGDPAALVKVKLAYDHAKALSVIPGNGNARTVAVEVLGQEKGKDDVFRLAHREWTDLLAAPTPAPLDLIPVSLHPDREVVLAVRLSVGWKTTTLETTWKEEKVPKQVVKTEMVHVYNPTTKRNEQKMQTRTVTEYDVRKHQVLENVTRSHSSGCTAKVALRPAKDGVYLVDYANLLVSEGCTAQGYQQTGKPDGSFQLTPVAL